MTRRKLRGTEEGRRNTIHLRKMLEYRAGLFTPKYHTGWGNKPFGFLWEDDIRLVEPGAG